MKIEELIKDLDPITIIEFKNKEMLCEKCGCKLYKNRETKSEIQKYICSGCKTTLSETTNTIICHSKLSFEIWSNVIDNLLNGFSLRRIAEENNISLLTSFRIYYML